MLFFSTLFALLLSGIVVAGDITLSSVRQAFEAANVSFFHFDCLVFCLIPYQIPNTLAISFDPKVLLEVTYPDASSGPITVRPGDQLSMNGKSS